MKLHNTSLIWCLTIAFALSFTGCKFGKKVNTDSSGITRVIGPSSLVRQPDGTYKINPASTNLPEAKPIKTKPVQVKPVRSKPTYTPEVKSAEANHKTKELESAKLSEKLPPFEASPISTRMNVIPNNGGTQEEGANEGQTQPPQSKVKIKYGELILFYLLGFLVLAFLFIVYDILRIKKEKEDLPKKSPKKKARRKRANPKFD